LERRIWRQREWIALSKQDVVTIEVTVYDVMVRTAKDDEAESLSAAR